MFQRGCLEVPSPHRPAEYRPHQRSWKDPARREPETAAPSSGRTGRGTTPALDHRERVRPLTPASLQRSADRMDGILRRRGANAG